MNPFRFPQPFVLGLLLLAHGAFADHGRSHLLVSDPGVPSEGGGFVTWNAATSEQQDFRETEVEMQYTLGVSPWGSLGLGAGGFDEEGTRSHSLTPQALLRWPGTTAEGRFTLGLATGYHFNRTEENDAGTSSFTHGSGFVMSGHVMGTPICGPEFGPDAPPCADDEHDHETTDPDPTPDTSGEVSPVAETTGSSSTAAKPTSSASAKKSTTSRSAGSSGSASAAAPDSLSHAHSRGTVHVHGENHFFARLILAARLGERDTLTANLIAVLPEDSPEAWGYAAGYRRDLSDRVAATVEALGDFYRDGYHLVGLGLMYEPVHHVGLKAGFSQGLTDASPDYQVQLGLSLEFH